ncbi:hypothetical protein [Streptomyces goshikiensis]|uniref:hypothetical protein n=1 Tax=Streptomyces goshikiensis TaxID=1942 RepID=UPI002ADFF201|nr:hypothetical protein [Streptomyces goshikiensis]
MSRAAEGPHPFTPTELPAGDVWLSGCDECQLPVQGGAAGLAAHRRTVHDPRRDFGDRRIPITVLPDLPL